MCDDDVEGSKNSDCAALPSKDETRQNNDAGRGAAQYQSASRK